MWMRENRREDANRLTRYSLAPSAITKIELTLTPVACEASSSPIRSEDMHYYRIVLCSRLFVPVVFEPGIIGGFYSGSNG